MKHLLTGVFGTAIVMMFTFIISATIGAGLFAGYYIMQAIA